MLQRAEATQSLKLAEPESLEQQTRAVLEREEEYQRLLKRQAELKEEIAAAKVTFNDRVKEYVDNRKQPAEPQLTHIHRLIFKTNFSRQFCRVVLGSVESTNHQRILDYMELSKKLVGNRDLNFYEKKLAKKSASS